MTQFNIIASEMKLNNLSHGIRREGNKLIIEPNYIQIYEGEIFNDISLYTKAPFLMTIEFSSNYLEKPEKLINYIKAAMDKQNEIEIMSIWLGEDFEMEKKACKVDDLDAKIIEWVFNYGGYKNPRKLKIFKYSKGKK